MKRRCLSRQRKPAPFSLAVRQLRTGHSHGPRARRLVVEPLESRCLLAAIGLGECTSGTISTASEVDVYTFSATANSVIALAVADTYSSPFQPYADLYTPTGGLLGTVWYGDKRVFTLPSGGTYSIQVYDSGHNGTGDYFVCLEGISPSSPDAVTIQRGDTRSGTLASKAEMDPYVFTAAANDVVTLSVANTYSYPFQPYADLYTATGSLVGTVWYGDKNVYTLPAAGTYTILVYDSGHNATGGYSIDLQGLKPSSLDALPIQLGDTKSGTIGAAGEVIPYVFTAAANDVVTLTVANTYLYPFQPYADLYGPTGNLVGTVWYGDKNVYTLSAAGTYTIQVYDSGHNATGDFTIDLQGIKPSSLDAAPIQLGDTKSGTIGAAGEVIPYVFNAAANDVVTLTVANTYSYPFQPYADLYGPTGNLVGTVWYGDKNVYTLSAAGTYTIQVYDSGHNATGDFTIDLQGISPPSLDALSLLCSQPHFGSIAVGVVDEYRFYGEVNDVVTLTVADTYSSPFQPYADLYTSAGSLLGTVWYGDSRQYTLPATGTYVIQVYDSGHNAAGDYNFTLQWTSPLKGCIAGQKFNDLDGDGVKESGEEGLQGWTVFLDANNNGALDSGERRTVTDILGNYSLTSLVSGSYHVREMPQNGWQQTKPSTGLYYPTPPAAAYQVALSAGQLVTGQDFGNTQTATISGLVWNDANGDGVQGSTEAPLSGWDVYLDSNNNGAWNSGEPRTTTGPDGWYRFIGLTPGTYRVRELHPAGWQQTWPTGDFYTVSLAAGAWFWEGHFGNREAPPSGFTVTPTSGLVTMEGGGTATFTVKLNSQPTANVALGLSSSDATEGTASPSNLTFTTSNWSTAQTVTVTGSDDWVDDGNIAYTIITAAAVSVDPNYSGLNPADVSVINVDDDTAGFTVEPTSGLVTTEGGGTATFAIKLNSQPTANVSLGLSSSDTTEGTISPTSLTWTPGNWNVAQTVTATGVEDTLVDGDIAYTLVTAPATSSDAKYNGLNPADVAATNLDNDPPGGPRQIVSDTAASYAGAAGAMVQFPVRYTTSNGDPTLTGLGLRMHFDSSKLVFQSLDNVLMAGFVQQQAPVDDTEDFDHDPSTDKFVLLAWSDISGQWPNQVLPTRLFDANFTLQAGLVHGTSTAVHFSASSTAAGYDFEGRSIAVAVAACSLDVDGNCIADALTDGILILRYLFGFTGTSLVEGALAPDATRTDPAAIVQFLDGGRSTMLDPDASGHADALTDGILILRYLFGFRGQSLVDGVLPPTATRTDPVEIAAFLDGFLPNCSQASAASAVTLSSVSAGETSPSTEASQAETFSYLPAASVSTMVGPADADGEISKSSDRAMIVAPRRASDIADDRAALGLRRASASGPVAAYESVDDAGAVALPPLLQAVPSLPRELSPGDPHATVFDRVVRGGDFVGLARPVWKRFELPEAKAKQDVLAAALRELCLEPEGTDLAEEDGPLSGLLALGQRQLATIEDVDELLTSEKWLE
jgi:hypothetical protein